MAITRLIPDCAILFADIVGFTSMSSKITATELVQLLNEIFLEFDSLAAQLHVEKIKTIGDCYMAATIPEVGLSCHVERIVMMGIQMQESIKNLPCPSYGAPLQIRVGVHTGPLVAGVIGLNKFAFDMWGDTVNIASRMESTGQTGLVHCSSEVASRLESNTSGFHLNKLSPIEVKGKGAMTTYLIQEVPSSWSPESGCRVPA